MIARITHSLMQIWNDLRPIGLYAAAAFVTGGSMSSVLVAAVWFLQHHRNAEARV